MIADVPDTPFVVFRPAFVNPRHAPRALSSALRARTGFVEFSRGGLRDSTVARTFY